MALATQHPLSLACRSGNNEVHPTSTQSKVYPFNQYLHTLDSITNSKAIVNGLAKSIHIEQFECKMP